MAEVESSQAFNGDLESNLEAAVRKYINQPMPGANRTAEYNEQRTRRRFREEDDPSIKRFSARVLAEVAPQASVVELGSGTGGISVDLARSGLDVLGIEPESGGIQASVWRARRYPEIRCRFEVGVAERLPIASESVDAVVSNQVIEHIRDIDGAAREMFRVLKPGGLVLHNMPNYAFPYEPHYRVPFPPRMSRTTGMRYLKLLGRDPKLFDDCIFPTLSASVIALFERHGFVGAHNRYAHEVSEKLKGATIRSARLQRVVKIFQASGILPIVRNVVMALELYPAIVFMAWKPPLPPNAQVLST